jgi:DNA-binding GntR family transcriptional regulator
MYAKTMAVPEPPPAVVPLHIQSVVDHVYASLRERILAGDLRRGTRLRQASLAEELGVSRTPLREALRRLATEGLVEFSPNRGATVSELDFGDMSHAWAARVALEPGAARLAAERRDPQAIARLRRAVELQRRALHDREPSYAANREFHLALAAASGNPHLTRFAEMLWVPRIGVPIYEAQAVERSDGVAAWADEHERITDAIAAGDAGLAEHLTRTHIAAHPPVGPTQG